MVGNDLKEMISKSMDWRVSAAFRRPSFIQQVTTEHLLYAETVLVSMEHSICQERLTLIKY